MVLCNKIVLRPCYYVFASLTNHKGQVACVVGVMVSLKPVESFFAIFLLSFAFASLRVSWAGPTRGTAGARSVNWRLQRRIGAPL